jgi:hypothetical protein
MEMEEGSQGLEAQQSCNGLTKVALHGMKRSNIGSMASLNSVSDATNILDAVSIYYKHTDGESLCQSHLTNISIVKAGSIRTYPVSFCRTMSPALPVCLPWKKRVSLLNDAVMDGSKRTVFCPSTTNRSSWKNCDTTVCLWRSGVISISVNSFLTSHIESLDPSPSFGPFVTALLHSHNLEAVDGQSSDAPS